MKLHQGGVPLGLKLTILLVLCLHLPGVTPRSVQLPEGGTPGRSRRQADDPEPRASEEEVMEFFEPLVRVLQEIPTSKMPSPDAILSWIPALRNLLNPQNQTATPGPTGQPEKPAAGSTSGLKASASLRAAAVELPVPSKPAVPKILASAQPPRLELPVSIQPSKPAVPTILASAQPPRLELPVSIQPRGSELASSAQPAMEELDFSSDEESC